jgi:superfamily I DNA and RNA helicase
MLLVFNGAFDASQRIPIQKFTEGDIQQLVKQKLEDNDQFKKLRETEEVNCMKFKQQILDNADGVFLWVTVLLNLLEDALISKDTMTQLQSIVTDTPYRRRPGSEVHPIRPSLFRIEHAYDPSSVLVPSRDARRAGIS